MIRNALFLTFMISITGSHELHGMMEHYKEVCQQQTHEKKCLQKLASIENRCMLLAIRDAKAYGWQGKYYERYVETMHKDCVATAFYWLGKSLQTQKNREWREKQAELTSQDNKK